MDPTIIAAIAGVLGVILGAVIGGVFALMAAKWSKSGGTPQPTRRLFDWCSWSRL